MARQLVEKAKRRGALEADQNYGADDIAVDLANICPIAANDAAFLQIGDTFAGGAARKPDTARKRLQRYARLLGENGQYLTILRIQFPHGRMCSRRKCAGLFRQSAGLTDALSDA